MDDQSWKPVVKSQLPDPRHKECDVPVLEFDMGETVGRYLELNLISYFQAGSGLQYMDVVYAE